MDEILEDPFHQFTLTLLWVVCLLVIGMLVMEFA